MLYLLLKTTHIISATILFGAGLGTAFYMWIAGRQFVRNKPGSLEQLSTVSQHVVLADWVLTTPAVIYQLLSGVALMYMGGYSLQQTWIITSLVLYCIAGLCWLPVVWLQIRIRDLARDAVSNGTEPDPRINGYYRTWFILGWPAFTAVIVIFFLMVMRPA